MATFRVGNGQDLKSIFKVKLPCIFVKKSMLKLLEDRRKNSNRKLVKMAFLFNCSEFIFLSLLLIYRSVTKLIKWSLTTTQQETLVLPSDLKTWVGPLHTSFTRSITKTHSHYPINLNDQTRKYKVNDYSCLNQCSTRKFASSIRQLLHPEGTTKSFLALSPVFPSSNLEPKKQEENRTLKMLAVHVSRDSRILMLLRRDSLPA